MSRRPPSTYLTADELKQIAAIKFSEAVPAAPGPEQQKILVSAHRYQNLAGDPATGDFSDAKVIRKFRDVPDDLSAL